MRNKLLGNILLGCFIALLLCVLFNPILNVFGRYGRTIDYAMLQDYVRSHKLNDKYAVVVDFNTHSGRHRFFLCDLQQKKIVASSLCAHGVGKGSTRRKPVFSNEVGSNCSCIGYFKIMKQFFKCTLIDSLAPKTLQPRLQLHSVNRLRAS